MQSIIPFMNGHEPDNSREIGGAGLIHSGRRLATEQTRPFFAFGRQIAGHVPAASARRVSLGVSRRKIKERFDSDRNGT
ncbi:MAG: hypothetical protein ACR2GX_07345 [Candidatus Dormibacteria bacterium]